MTFYDLATSLHAADRLGCELWIEPTDTTEHIERLCHMAVETGLGWLRIFLMWPWLEATPDQWDFTTFDAVFVAAHRHGLRIKATLTANSGPWHIGTPSMLHSHTGFFGPQQREPMRRYLAQCVTRYYAHPALGQWIVWNEPAMGNERTPETLVHWRAWLVHAYDGNLSTLNRRWRTGFDTFDAIPFPEDISLAVHRGEAWNSYGPWLADWKSRAAWLAEEIAWVAARVRELDVTTPLCINPRDVFTNHAEEALDLARLGEIVDVMGASYHPVWHFMFAPRASYPALMAAGVRLQAAVPSIRAVEVTEVQTGNTVTSSTRPSDATPSEIARFFLAALAAGAESVTGWCLNSRSQDYEAGDWGLLDDLDQHSDRSRMLRHLHDRLDVALARTGPWRSATANAYVVADARSQAIEWVEGRHAQPVPGRMSDDGLHGAALTATRLMHCGAVPDIIGLGAIPAEPAPGALLVLGQVQWDEADAVAILRFAARGGTVLLDAASGRRDLDARLHRPWPGGLAGAVGIYATGLHTEPDGHALLWHDMPVGASVLTRLSAALDPAARWRAWSDLRFTSDGAPCVWERPYGQGRIIITRFLLGASLVHAPATVPALTGMLRTAMGDIPTDIVLSGPDDGGIIIPVQTERGTLHVILAPDASQRGCRPVHVRAPAGNYHDLWADTPVDVGSDSEMALDLPQGIALLWRANRLT